MLWAVGQVIRSGGAGYRKVLVQAAAWPGGRGLEGEAWRAWPGGRGLEGEAWPGLPKGGGAGYCGVVVHGGPSTPSFGRARRPVEGV